MNKFTKTLFVIVLASVLASPVVMSADNVKSLRGYSALDDTRKADPMKRIQKDTAPIQRNYIQQPPLIPHSIRGYRISQKHNKCLSCHSWENYREFGATKISQTHFTNREGIDLADVSPGRFFCTQCHVPQADTAPLVKNIFKPVDALNNR